MVFIKKLELELNFVWNRLLKVTTFEYADINEYAFSKQGLRISINLFILICIVIRDAAVFSVYPKIQQTDVIEKGNIIVVELKGLQSNRTAVSAECRYLVIKTLNGISEIDLNYKSFVNKFIHQIFCPFIPIFTYKVLYNLLSVIKYY